jgi:hypothetical protein
LTTQSSSFSARVLPHYFGPGIHSDANLTAPALHHDSFRYIVVVSVAHPALPFQKRDQI